MYFDASPYQVTQVLSEIDNFRQSLSLGQNLTEIVNLVCNMKLHMHAYKYSYSSSFFSIFTCTYVCVCVYTPMSVQYIHTYVCVLYVRTYIQTYVHLFAPFLNLSILLLLFTVSDQWNNKRHPIFSARCSWKPN